MMSKSYISDIAKLVGQLSRFIYYVHHVDGRSGYISFRDSSGFLGCEEYKSRIAEVARKRLNFKNWDESWIGTGKIADCAKRAMGVSGNNLVDDHQKTDFGNRLDRKHSKYHPEAERVLYDIYRNPLCDEATAFSNAVKTFGAKYDTIAFLFFIKDDTRFLPVSPGHFDKGFAIIGIDYVTSYRCGWENYQGFIDIIKDIRDVMEDMLPMKGTPRLIDAHSFVWVIQEDRFIEWTPDAEQSIQIEQTAEEYIQGVVSGTGGRRRVTSSVFNRSADVVKKTRMRAKAHASIATKQRLLRTKRVIPIWKFIM